MENRPNWRLHSPRNLRWHLAQAINAYRREERGSIDHQYWRTLALLARLQLDVMRAEQDSEIMDRLEELERQVAKIKGLRIA